MKKRGLFISAILAILTVFVFFWVSNGLSQTVSTNNEQKTAKSIDELPTALTLNLESDINEGGIDIEEVYKSAPIVFIGKYLGDDRVLSIGDHINTEASFEVTKVLKGNIPSDRMKNNIVKVQYHGGQVTLDEFYNNMTSEMKNDPKNKIGSIPVEKRKQQKVVQYVKKQSLKDKTKNQEYLVCVSDNPVNSMQPNPYYFNMFQEYGISKLDKNGKVYDPDTQTFKKVSFYTR